jgi:hypothetical protein
MSERSAAAGQSGKGDKQDEPEKYPSPALRRPEPFLKGARLVQL